MKFRVTLDGIIASSNGDIGESVRQVLDVAMEELNGLGARNAAIDLNHQTGEIVITCAVEAPDPVAAVQPASDNIRLALQKAEIGTHEWPATDDSHWTVEWINSRAEALTAA